MTDGVATAVATVLPTFPVDLGLLDDFAACFAVAFVTWTGLAAGFVLAFFALLAAPADLADDGFLTATGFAAGFFALGFFTAVCLASGFFEADCLVPALLAVTFLATTFLAVAFLVVAGFVTAFFGAGFLAVTFLPGTFLVADFLLTGLLGVAFLALDLPAAAFLPAVLLALPALALLVVFFTATECLPDASKPILNTTKRGPAAACYNLVAIRRQPPPSPIVQR